MRTQSDVRMEKRTVVYNAALPNFVTLYDIMRTDVEVLLYYFCWREVGKNVSIFTSALQVLCEN